MAGLKGVVRGTELVAARKLISFSDSLSSELTKSVVHREIMNISTGAPTLLPIASAAPRRA